MKSILEKLLSTSTVFRNVVGLLSDESTMIWFYKFIFVATITALVFNAVVIAVLLAVVAIAVLYLGKSLVIVKAKTRAIVLENDNRTTESFREGPHIINPFSDSIMPYDNTGRTSDVSSSFICKDDLSVTLNAAYQWRPDLSIIDTKEVGGVYIKVIKFPENSEKVAIDQVNFWLKSIMGRITSQLSRTELNSKKREIERLLDCSARLKKPPHKDPLMICKPCDGDSAGVSDQKKKAEAEIKAKGWENGVKKISERLEFYGDFSDLIDELLIKEHEKYDEHSIIEEMYGIDIEKFELFDPIFTEETKKAIAAAKEAEARLQISKTITDKANERVAASGGKISFQSALDSIEVELQLPGVSRVSHNHRVEGTAPEKLIILGSEGGK
ncbi:MAG: hypothetical protein PHN74_02330 [Candidatus Pacebacteria bacterium]|nr:hypothetical protein [Candidatus Paceibacterota bacterium]